MDNRVEDATVPRTSGLTFHVLELNDAEPSDIGCSLDGSHLREANEGGSYGRLLEPETDGTISRSVVVKCLRYDNEWIVSFRNRDYFAPFRPNLKETPWTSFYREYAALKSIGRDYAPAVYAFGYVSQSDGCDTITSPAIVMERLGNGPGNAKWMSLRKAIEGGAIYEGKPEVFACTRIGVLLTDAVQHMRNLNVLHHDISASNVFLHIDSMGHVAGLRLIDFGQAAHVDGTQTNIRPGTPSYAAPEMVVFNSDTPYLSKELKQILRASKNSPGSDIWPIGAALYHIRTHKLPKYDYEAMANGGDKGRADVIITKLLGLTLEEDLKGGLNETDKKLNVIIKRCTQARAENRPNPSDLIDMLSELDEMLSRKNVRYVERTPVFHQALSDNKSAKAVLMPSGSDATPAFSTGTAANTPTDVFAAVYRVVGMAGDSPKILVLGASEQGCHANGIRIDGVRHPLQKEAVVSVPSNGGDHESCPWTEVERVYIRETVRPISMRGWFDGCSKLKSIRGLDNIDTSLSKSMRRCFAGCSSLVSLDVSSWDVSAIEDLSACFYGCSSLVSLDVSGWDVSAVKKMPACFQDCSSLVSLDVSSWDVSAVEDLSGCFAWCSSLVSLDVSGWDVSAVKKMPLCLAACPALVSLDVSSWDVSAVEDFSYCFSGCSSLASIDVSGWRVSAVTATLGMFNNCSLLEFSYPGWYVSTDDLAWRYQAVRSCASGWLQVAEPILRGEAHIVRTGVTVSYIGERNRWGKYEVDGAVAYDVDTRSNWAPKNGKLVLYGVGDSGLASILAHGYPYTSLCDGGDIDRFITQAAVWWYLRDCYGIGAISEGFAKTDADPYSLRKHITALVEQAKEARDMDHVGIYDCGGRRLTSCLFALEGEDKPLAVSLANPNVYL